MQKRSNGIYDDETTKEINIKLCPYDIKDAIRFGIYSVPEATGYFQVKKNLDCKEGDQVIFQDKTYTILRVDDCYLFNKVENKIIQVK